MPQLKRAYTVAGTGNLSRKRSRSASYVSAARLKTVNVLRPTRALRSAGVEVKVFDTKVEPTALVANNDMSGMEFNPAATAAALFLPVQGLDSDDRIGKQVTVKTIQLQGYFLCDIDDASDLEPPCAFVSLVKDKANNAAAINSEDVYTNTMSDNNGNTMAMRNSGYRDRFEVLRFQRVNFADCPTLHELKKAKIEFSFYIKLNDTLTFPSNNSAPEGISYHVIAGTTDGTIGTSGNTKLAYNARITYTD